MKERNHYFLIGITTLGLLLSTSGLILWKRNIVQQVQSISVIGRFENINGLLENAVVKYRGYPVGRVTTIKPSPNHIDVHLYIDSQYAIPKGSSLKIVFDGLVGEKYLEIIPHKTASDKVVSNDVLRGYSTAGLSDFIDIGTQNLLELQAILNTMADVFGNEDISLAIKDMVFNLKTTANNMNQIIEELSKISSSNRVSNILEETETLLSNLNQTLSKDDYEKIKRVIDNFEEFSNDLKEITNDDQLKTSLLSTLEETRSTFSQSNSFFNTLRNIELKTSAGLNHIYNSTSSGYLMYLVNIDFYLNASFLNFGISNFNKKDQLMTILVNSPLDQQWWFKYGINKESPGFGIMYRQKNIPLSGSMIFYNIDDVDIDMDISYNIYRRWSLAAGGFQINKPLRAIYIGASFK